MKKHTPKLPPPGPRLVGYARVSTEEQSLDMQINALVNAGVHPDNIWSEHKSGVAKNRPELAKALIDARHGDTFVVWKLDRLGRDLSDLLERMKEFEANGVGFRSLTEGIDTTTPVGKLLLHVIGALAQFERDLIVERTREGVRVHRLNGGAIGQPLKMDKDAKQKARSLFKLGKKVRHVAKELGVATGTVYNHFSAAEIKALRGKKKEQ